MGIERPLMLEPRLELVLAGAEQVFNPRAFMTAVKLSIDMRR